MLLGEITVEVAGLLTSGLGIKAGSRLAKLAADTKYGSRVLDAITAGAEKAGIAHERVVSHWKKAPERGSFGENAADAVKNSNQKSIQSLEKRLIEHQDKLTDYKKDPTKYDNKGFLENAPSEEVRKKIINQREKHLEAEIQNFKNWIDRLKNGDN